MSRRNKIIVSLVGIFIILLALLGITYGYFLTRIVGNTNDNSISITTANLRLVYTDGTPEVLTASNIIPGTIVSTKTFSVTNGGDQAVEYDVYIENVINTFTVDGQKDVKLKITCTSKVGENDNGSCTGYDNAYPATNSKLIETSIEIGETHYYELEIEYEETYKNQSADMGKEIQGKIQIYNPKDVVAITGTVTGYDSSYYVELHSEVKTSQIIEEEITDDEGNIFKVGRYIFYGVGTENHTIYVKKIIDGKISEIGNSNISVTKGNEASITENASNIVINDDSAKAIVNININNSSNITLSGEKIEEYNPYNEGTLAYNIYYNSKKNINGTKLVDTPLTNPAIEPSAMQFVKTNTHTTVLSKESYQISKLYIAYSNDYSVDTSTGLLSLGSDNNPVTIMDTPYVYSSDLANTLAGKYVYWVRNNPVSKASDLTEIKKISDNINDITENSISYYSITNLDNAVSNEKILAPITDAHGKGFYFRGGVQDNYVLFNSMCFRVVRIEGDGSVKLSFAGYVSDNATNCNELTETSALLVDDDNNIIKTDYGYEKYVPGEFDWGPEVTYARYNYNTGLGSYLKQWFDWNFRNNGISDEHPNEAGVLVKEDNWCKEGRHRYLYENLATTGQYYYASGLRRNNTYEIDISCYDENYVVYLVGTLTSDEIALAGGVKNNKTHYLYENAKDNSYWTLSLSSYEGSYDNWPEYDYVFINNNEGGHSAKTPSSNLGVRPAITLTKDAEISSGNGTKSNPYVIIY